MPENPNPALGHIVILNGPPRSGKTSIARAIQNSFEGLWINLGVDHYMKMTPERFQPGIGLRPGGERPDLEPLIARMYAALYESIAAHSRRGIHVVADMGHHDAYSAPLGILPRCARILRGHPVLFVGVTCPMDEIMKRRVATSYPSYAPDGSIPAPIQLWQEAVHRPGIYDLVVDTSTQSPGEIAARIQMRLMDGDFTAFSRLARLDVDDL